MTHRGTPRAPWRRAPALLAAAGVLAAGAWGFVPETTGAPLHPDAPPAAATAPPAAAPVAGTGPLQAQAEAMVGNANGWSVMAWSIDRKQPLFAVNAETVRTPASNNKVFTAVWALSMLGPDYRFPTDVLLGGPVQGGAVRGDVIIKGSGDPAFGYTKFDKDPMTSPRAMARALKARGITRVDGGVVADATVFDSLAFGPNWPLDTGNGVSAYAPTVSGLAYQRNMLWVAVQNGAYKLEPEVPEIPVVVRGGGGRGVAVRKPGEDTIYLRGGVGGRAVRRYGIGAADPALLGAAALRQALREEGITVAGPVRRGVTPKGATLVHRHYSLPLWVIIHVMNHESDNFFAEHLWKAAGARALGQGSYERGGLASSHFYHDRAGVPYGELFQADGSGLSADNRTSALAMTRALIYADRQPWRERFHESLPVGGKKDGTLRNLFHGTYAEGNLHAKTGYIKGVRSLSGFVKTRGGERVVFSFLYNGPNTSGSRAVQQNLGNLLAEYTK